jgi:molybdopterin-binding protein
MINGTKHNIVIEDSTFNNNGLVGIDLGDGEAITVSISNNTVMNNRDSGIGTLGLRNAVVQSNTVANNGRFGIELKNPNGDGTVAGPNRVLVQGNTVSRSMPMTTTIDGRDLAGIGVIRRSVTLPINPDVPSGVVVRNNTVSGFVQEGDHEGFGIVVEGAKNDVYGNTVTGNEVGLQVQQSSGRGYPGDNNTGGAGSPATNDDWFDRGNAQQTCLNVGVNTLSSNSLIDYREVGSPGLYRVYNLDTNEGFCTIQAAIDDADTSAGHTISVTAGVYIENVIVNKSVTLLGAKAGQDANARVAAFVGGKADPAVESIIQPPVNNPTGGNPGAMDLFRVLSSNVTLDGFVLDGNNASLGSSSIVMDGVAAHARRGLTNIDSGDNFNPVNNLVVNNNIF